MQLDIGYAEPSVHWATLAILLALPALLGLRVWKRSESSSLPVVLVAALLGIAAEMWRVRAGHGQPWPVAAAELALTVAIIVLPALLGGWSGRRYLVGTRTPRRGVFVALLVSTWLVAAATIALTAPSLLSAVHAASSSARAS